MRKRKLTFGLFSLMMAASVALTGNVNVSAATKKLSVNRVYENATVIKGNTKKKNVVKVKVGKKTYKVKANKKGKFKVKVPKVKAGKKYTVKSYKKKKLYAKKTVYGIAKTVKVNKFTPSSRTISGYTRPSYKVQVTVNGKKYTKKANANSGAWKMTLSKKIGSDNVKVRVIKKNGKTFTVTTATHTHDYKPVYKTVHHDAQGHYETVTVPAYDETKMEYHDICLVCGRDKTQDFINSILNKTYPDLDQATKDSWGYTKEKGWSHYSEDYAIYKEMGVTNEEMKDVPPYGMYLAAGGWDEKCDGHNYSNRLVPTIVHHEASTKQEWKVDKKAYDEKIITGYQCACGKTK